MLRREEGVPNIVMIGLPNVASLRRAEAKLVAAQIPHYSWHEPDFDLGFTAIATSPIRGEQRRALANYRVYKAPIAQHSERQALNLEVVGEDPTRCANFNGAGTDASSVRV